jgi:hypothetical protein
MPLSDRPKCISLTITLTPLQYDHMVEHGMFCLSELGDLGLVKPFMPSPSTQDAERDVAIFGVQEMIATSVYRSRSYLSEDTHDDDVPF